MKITLFSGNQPRHLALARKLSDAADEVYFISEVSTIFPGIIDDFFKKSKIENFNGKEELEEFYSLTMWFHNVLKILRQ